MKARLLHEHEGQRTFVLALETGDEVTESMLSFSRENRIRAAAVAKRDGSAWGGHLQEAEVRPTLEVIVTESPPALHRRSDPDTGLALLDL
ncbi:MAG TPA: hypothetical protein VKA47_06920 [Solirubrobacterales bacterium]|nr:hypothetical protein [Solirubrobacterales bacterium]